MQFQPEKQRQVTTAHSQINAISGVHRGRESGVGDFSP